MRKKPWPIDQTVEFDSLDELLTALLQLGDPRLLYRGQGDFDWTLTSTLTRRLRDYAQSGGFDLGLLESPVVDDRLDRLADDVEERLLRAFVDEADRLAIPDLPPHEDRLAWWELMQHHGAPTRLLDWTRSPFIALWFAVEGADLNDRDAALWILNSDNSWINHLDRMSSLEREQEGSDDFLDTRTWQNRLARLAIAERAPVALVVHPRFAVPRVVAQQSVMTLVSNVQEPTGSQHYVIAMLTTKVRVRAEWRAEILRRCDSLGLTRLDLFRDLDSLGDTLATSLSSNALPSITQLVARTWLRNA